MFWENDADIQSSLPITSLTSTSVLTIQPQQLQDDRNQLMGICICVHSL